MPDQDALERAVDRYFNLFVKDWLIKKHFSRETEEEIKAMLLDFAHFLADNSSNSHGE